MNFVDERLLDPRAQELRQRVLEVLPAGGYQLDRLFRLLDIEISEEVETAEVTVGLVSRMRFNPRFVERHCATDERLFVLVLHELLHVVLGHTRLFPKPTYAHNIAFDAVINAMIARQHKEPEFLELLREVNSWTDFPSRLLRPAPGWPEQPEPMPQDATKAERELHTRLYGKDSKDVTYHELFELLAQCVDERVPGPARLLGGHGPGSDRTGDGASANEFFDGDEAVDPTLRDVLQRIVREWPAPFREQMLDRGQKAHDLALNSSQPADAALERALFEFFERAGLDALARRTRRRRTAVEHTAWSVVPQGADRRGHVRTLCLGRPPLFWEAPSTRTSRLRSPVPAAFVYLDVSGSMDPYLGALRSALRKPVLEGAARLFSFSTLVAEIDVRTFGTRATRSTGGTDVDAVLQHVLALPARERPQRIAIVTDGFVGKPRADRVRQLAGLGIGVHVALVANGSRTHLEAMAQRMVELPAPATTRSQNGPAPSPALAYTSVSATQPPTPTLGKDPSR
ncbi:MAG: hypothetical protein ABL997_06855 [Planctomycetota bacterium]